VNIELQYFLYLKNVLIHILNLKHEYLDIMHKLINWLNFFLEKYTKNILNDIFCGMWIMKGKNFIRTN
jgi:hypothetical protein